MFTTIFVIAFVVITVAILVVGLIRQNAEYELTERM